MRILLTVHAEPHGEAGASGVTLRLAEAYRARGHETLVLSFGDLPDRLPTMAKQLLFPSYVARRARRIVSRGHVDVMDASTGDTWVYSGLRRATGPLLVVRSHGLEHTLDREVRARAEAGGEPLSWKYPYYNGGARLWEVTRSLRSADVSLYLNQDDRAFATDRLGVAPERALLVRNGIPQAFLGLPAPTPSAPGLRIALLGSYTDLKGMPFAATALNRLLPLHPDWTVSFLGTGCSLERVRKDYDPAVWDQLAVVPRYANGELPVVLAGHEVHLFPSLKEGSPLALLESMACGLAPVVSRIPGPIEVITDGADGLLVPPGSPEAIVEALEAVAGDLALLDRLRAGAHRTAQDYGWDAIAEQQLNIYETATARRSTSR